MESAQNIHELVKNELLELYQAFALVCGRLRLRHWMGFGTLLGTVRHHGFIPWDDDLDVYMMREEYEAFLAAANKELPEYFKLVTFRNCSAYSGAFAKIQESRRDVYLAIHTKANYINPHGLYIDIFPLDGIPESTWDRAMERIRFFSAFCRHSHLFRHGAHASLKGSLCEAYGRMLRPFFSGVRTENDFAKLSDKWARKYSARNSSFLRVFSIMKRFHGNGREWIMPAKSFDETLLMPFEGREVPVPKGYDGVLRALYGDDYMTPPPPAKRVSEHSKAAPAPWIYGPDTE